jgi:hypothetical protein
MANRERGEASITVGEGASQQTYTFRLSMNDICSLEEAVSSALGKPVTYPQITERAIAGSMTYMRWVFWGALQHYHAGMTIQEAGELIESIGLEETQRKLAAIAEADSRDVDEAMPKTRGTRGGPANPQPAGRGTGEPLNSEPVPPA